MKKVFITRMLPQENMEELHRHFDVSVNPHDRPLTRDELKNGIKDCDAAITLLTDTIDGEILDAAGHKLKIVANYAVGYNNFDLKAATMRGVILTNTPAVLDDATADLSFALLLAVARRVVEADLYLRNSKWKTGWAPTFFVGLDVTGKTLGIAGLGRIGKNLARKARGFDMRILYSDMHRDEEFERQTAARHVSKETLLKESDFLSLHVPLLPETRHYIGETELALMKRTAVLINASRGPVVDEKALVKALKERRIWGAGLDVFENEPALEPGLAELDNVVIVPHIASATVVTRRAMGEIAIGNVIEVLNGRSPDTCVNPDVLQK
ncbi:MAG: D-glycerate dehydrogenase [Alphaproteobacteria bacterium]|nr:D-glycerate dehydrogenase [Alphaproteobacteria bacterium]